MQLDPGDVVITYTDGVVEAANQSGEEWGVQRPVDLQVHGRLLQRVPDGRCDISSFAGALTPSMLVRTAHDNSEKEERFKNEVRQDVLSQITKEFPKGWLDLCRLAEFSQVLWNPRLGKGQGQNRWAPLSQFVHGSG